MQFPLKSMIVGVSLLILFTEGLIAQTTREIIQEIVKDYYALRYEEAEKKARRALEDYKRFSPSELVELHTYLGCTLFALGNIEAAKKEFRTALSLNPHLTLDPVYISPKIISIFEEVKAEWKPEKQEEVAKEIRYIFVPDKRPGAAVRSLIFPGWGQLYKGERKKGVILMSLSAVSLGGLLYSQIAQVQAHDRYLEAKVPAEIESRYKHYNNLYKTRNSLILLCAALWAYSYIDAALKGDSGVAGFSRPQTAHPLNSAIQEDALLLSFIWQW